MLKTPKKIKAVIFDMDGVIIDSEPLHSLSWEKLLKKYNIKPLTNKLGLIHDVGYANDNVTKTIMKKHNLKEDIELVKRKRRKIFEEIIREKGAPMPGLLGLLKNLKKEKIKIAVASNRILRHVNLILETLKIKDFFDVIIGRVSNMKTKPAPDLFLKTARKLKVKGNECVALEDTEVGVMAAKNAGMKIIAIPNKFTKHHNFSNADKIVNSLNKVTIPLINNL